MVLLCFIIVMFMHTLEMFMQTVPWIFSEIKFLKVALKKSIV